MLKEFRDFIARGNVIDLAVGIIMGTAFGAVVKSLVDDVIMPPIGLILGGVDFSNLYLNLSGKAFASLEEAKKAGAATINYGVFLNTIISFLVIAFAVYLIVKVVNQMHKQAAPAPAGPTPSEQLLMEIRDLLKKGR